MSSMFFLKVKKKKKKKCLGITIIPLKHHISPSSLPLPYFPLLLLDMCYYHMSPFTVWQRSSPPSGPCCQEICLLLEWIMTAWRRSSHSYVTWNTLTRKAWRQRLSPPLLLSWIECCMGKWYAFLAALEDICSFQKPWQHRIKSTCSPSWLSYGINEALYSACLHSNPLITAPLFSLMSAFGKSS